MKDGSKDESKDKGWVKGGRMDPRVGLMRGAGMKDGSKDRPEDEEGVQIWVKG